MNIDRRIHLKIKLATLKAESRFIRKEEQKALKRNREVQGGTFCERYEDLRAHRRGVVRPVARTNHLAYGFLRGVPYVAMESSCDKVPDMGRVKAVAKRFSNQWDEEAWGIWKTAAKAHLKGGAPSDESKLCPSSMGCVQDSIVKYGDAA